MLECTLESAVCRHAERTGWIARKTVYLGRRGCPDRHFYGHGRVELVEFKQKGRRPDPLQAREHAQVRERDGDACFYCGKVMLFDPGQRAHGHAATLEHLRNQRDGGGQGLDNLALAHRRCNTSRSQMSLEQKLASRVRPEAGVQA